MRFYLKNANERMSLNEFAKKNGADYLETRKWTPDAFAVWKMPQKVGEIRAALALYQDGTISFGGINEACDNFEIYTEFYPKEVAWIAKMIPKLLRYKEAKE